jgi:hypothetical protein
MGHAIRGVVWKGQRQNPRPEPDGSRDALPGVLAEALDAEIGPRPDPEHQQQRHLEATERGHESSLARLARQAARSNQL